MSSLPSALQRDNIHNKKKDLLIACMVQEHLLLFTNRNPLTCYSLFQYVFPSGLAATSNDHIEQNGGYHSAKSTYQPTSLHMASHFGSDDSFWSTVLPSHIPTTPPLTHYLKCTLLPPLSRTLALQPLSEENTHPSLPPLPC